MQGGGVRGALVQCMLDEIPSTGLNKGREYLKGGTAHEWKWSAGKDHNPPTP